MNEVSGAILHYYRESAERHGLPFEAACAEIPNAADLLSRRRRWYDWEDHRRFLLRLEALCGRAGIELMASQVRERQVAHSLVALARSFTDPYLLYWAGFKLVAPTLYRHIRFRLEESARDRLRIVIDIPEPHGESHVFFYSWLVALTCTPALLGLPNAIVNAEFGGRRGVFDVYLPQSQSLWCRARRRLSAIVGSRVLVVALERERQNLQEALEQQLRVERELIEALPDLVLRLDVRATLIDVLGNAEHALAQTLRSLRGQPLSRLAAHFPGADGAVQSVCADIAAALAGRQPQPRSVALTIGQQQAFFDWRCVPNGDQVLSLVRDVSLERRLEGELLIADRTASLGLLAASITHEINNPLTYVLGNLETLEKALAESPSRGRGVQLEQVLAAKDGAARITEIVRGLSSFARPSSDQLGPVDVHAVLDAMVQLTSNVLVQRARVVKDYGTVPLVEAAEGRLGQVFVNLLVNAAQSLPERPGALGEIHLRSFCSADGQVAIEIRDDGVGISPEQRPHVFDPFYTTKPMGTGLGLFISQRIVADLNGELELESTPGKGTTFRVILKAANAPPEALAKVAPAPRREPSKRNVLVVDDQEPTAEAIKLLLSEHDVTLSTRGEQALRLMAEREFDVVLCDVMMPEMSGADIYLHVAAARPGYERRFVFMTGGAFPDSLQSFLASTAQPCLEKPFAYQQVQDAMRSVVTLSAG